MGMECDVFEAAGPHVATIIWLCGIGQGADDLLPITARLNLGELGFRSLFPRPPAKYSSRLASNSPVPAWFNQGLAGSSDADIEELNAASDALQKLLAAEASEIGAHRVFLAGFSQGAAMALIAGLRFPQRLAGIILYAAYWVKGADLLVTRSPSSKATPVWLGHGKRDWIVPARIGGWLRWILTELGYTVSWNLYPVDHKPFFGAVDDVRHFMNGVLYSGVL